MLNASTNGKYAMPISLRHQPVNMVIPFRFAESIKSVISLVLPAPASPETTITVSFPLLECSKDFSNSKNSNSLPTKDGSLRIPKLILENESLSKNTPAGRIYIILFIVQKVFEFWANQHTAKLNRILLP